MSIHEYIKLWDHQRKTVEKASAEGVNEWALFFQMGCGKTAASINIARHKYYQHKRILRTLVLCPPVVRTNWKREFAMHASEAVAKNTFVLDGPGKKRVQTFEKFGWFWNEDERGDARGSIFVTNYEALQMTDLFTQLKLWQPEVIIYDEIQLCKNYKAKRTKLATQLADKAVYKYILSGTPILNSPMDIWSQYRILDGGKTFDKNYFAFRAKFFIDRNAGMPSSKYFPDWQPIPKLAEIFNDKIYKKADRVLKKDCLDLPPLVRKRYEIEMVPDQQKLYKDMAKHFIAYLDSKACVASIALVKGLRLQQITSGFFCDDEGKDHEFKKNPRMDVLKDLVAELNKEHKIIIWACFKRNYQQIAAMLEAEDVEFVYLTGGMTDKSRQESVDNFQDDPKCRVMIANQAAGGVGVNLTAASYSIYYSRSFNLEHDLQSEARNHRGGSEIFESITRIDLVTKDSIDDIILAALSRKENMANSILKVRDLL